MDDPISLAFHRHNRVEANSQSLTDSDRMVTLMTLISDGIVVDSLVLSRDMPILLSDWLVEMHNWFRSAVLSSTICPHENISQILADCFNQAAVQYLTREVFYTTIRWDSLTSRYTVSCT